MNNLHNFTIGTPVNKATKVLTLADIQAKAPSVFTTERDASSTSNKYSFIPTTRVLDALQSNGWVPVKATGQTRRVQAVRSIAEDMRLNQGVWELAEKIAA